MKLKNYGKRFLALLLALIVFSSTVISAPVPAYATGAEVIGYQTLFAAVQSALIAMGLGPKDASTVSTYTDAIYNTIGIQQNAAADDPAYTNASSFVSDLVNAFNNRVEEKFTIPIEAYKYLVTFLSFTYETVTPLAKSFINERVSSLINSSTVDYSYQSTIGADLLDETTSLPFSYVSNTYGTLSEFLTAYGYRNLDFYFCGYNTFTSGDTEYLDLYIPKRGELYAIPYLNASNQICIAGADGLFSSKTYYTHFRFSRLITSSSWSLYRSENHGYTSAITNLRHFYYKMICVSLAEVASLLPVLVASQDVSGLYGDGSAASTVTEEGLVVSLDTTALDQISQAIADAIANNPGITREDLNDLVNAIISGINDTVIPDNITIDDRNIVSSITSVFNAISQMSVSITPNISTITNSVKMVQAYLATVQNAVKTMAGDIGLEFSDILVKADVITAWASTFSKVLGDVFISPDIISPWSKALGDVFINEGLISSWTKALGDVYITPELLETWSKALGDVFISEDLIGAWSKALGDILTIPDVLDVALPIGFPKELADELGKVITIPGTIDVAFPDIAFPDYTGLLEKILEAIQSIFAIDTAQVETATKDLEDEWDKKYPFIPILYDKVRDVSFPSTYDYPVISIKTPQILLPYYKTESIVLLNFKDYATHLLWARTLVRAMIWSAFLYSMFKHFRVRLHIG